MSTLHDYWFDFIERCKHCEECDYQTHAGATPEKIQSIEQKYKIRLPASYKAFLEVTNGLTFNSLWEDIDPIYPIDEVRPIQESGWSDMAEEIWYEQLDNKEYQFPEEDYQFFYDRYTKVVDQNGLRVPFPPKGKEYLETAPFRYSDHPYLVLFGHINDYDTQYYFNLNSEPQKGEPEVWLVRFDHALTHYNFCIKYLNFTECAESLLLPFMI